MKLAIGACVVLAGLAFAAPASAGPDDAKWVARCVSDNAGAKVAVDIISKYCTCMNNEMDNNETRSISTWETRIGASPGMLPSLRSRIRRRHSVTLG